MVNIRIIPVNDHQVEFVDNLQTTIWLEENSQTCLSLQNLDATDADIGRDSILFEIVRRPIRGQLLTRGETAQQFDRSDLSSGVICYKHVGEIGNQIVVDQFDIIAKDQFMTTCHLFMQSKQPNSIFKKRKELLIVKD